VFSVSSFGRKRSGKFGNPIFYFDQIESTNDIAERLARQGCPEGAVILANEQTAGKGRKGNPWFSPPDLGLYFSLVLRPSSEALKFLPYVACLSVKEALGKLGIAADLKWPNDVVVRERKLAGILIQTAMEDQRLQFAVVGCGINVNVREFPDHLQETATSIVLESGALESREALLASALIEFENLYGKIDPAEWQAFAARLERASTYLSGCSVAVEQNGRIIEGVTRGLDGYGGLKIETPGGEEIVYSGEVVSCRKK
jgi:BirA family biotin operon repressor/biotin-[acetyl-CoA-carboxylase] ligase